MILNIISLRLKQIYKNKSILVLAIVITIIFAVLVSGIYEEVSKETVLNVGVIDLDQTQFSENVIGNVDNHSLFNQTVVTYEEGISQLKKHEIELMYIIREGAMDQVDDSDYSHLIDLYFIGDNYLSPLLGDVLVGEEYVDVLFHFEPSEICKGLLRGSPINI